MITVGIFAGSFNPFHDGHLDILNQAKEIFDVVFVVRCVNPEKPEPTETSNYITHTHTGLLSEFIDKIEKDYDTVVLVKGLRNTRDLEYEEEQIHWIKTFKPNLKHVFILCNNENRFISSTAIKTLKKINP